jgi:hypothetical protein
VLGWNGPDEVLTLLTVPGQDACCGPDAYELTIVPIDGRQNRTLMRIPDLQSYGVGRFQLASATIDNLRVVAPAEVDRGGWPPWLLGGIALILGLLAYGAMRAVPRTRPARRPAKLAGPATGTP